MSPTAAFLFRGHRDPGAQLSGEIKGGSHRAQNVHHRANRTGCPSGNRSLSGKRVANQLRPQTMCVLRRGDTEPIPAPLHRGSQVTDLASLGACTPNEAETELKMTTEEKNHPSTGNTNKNIDTVLDNFGEGADPLMLPHMKVINRAGSVRGVVCVFRKTGLRFGSGRKSHSHERVLVSFRVSVNASVCHE